MRFSKWLWLFAFILCSGALCWLGFSQGSISLTSPILNSSQEPAKEGWGTKIGVIYEIFVPSDGKSALLVQDPSHHRPIPGELIRPEIHRIGTEFPDTGGNYGPAYPDGVSSIAFSPDGKPVLRGRDDGSIGLEDMEKAPSSKSKHKAKDKGNLIKEFKGHKASVRALAWAADGKTFLSAAQKEGLRLWNVETGEAVAKLDRQQAVFRSVALSPDGKWAVCAADESEQGNQGTNVLQIWDLATGKLAHRIASFAETMQFSSDGKHLLVLGAERRVEVRKVPSWNVYASFAAAPAAAFTTDGHYVILSQENRVHLWEIRSAKVALTFEGEFANVKHTVPLPEGNRVLIEMGTEIVLSDLRSGEQIRTLLGGKIQGSTITSVAFLPDGKQLLARSKEGATLWDLTTGKPIRVIRDLYFGAHSVSADGKLVLASSPIGIWDITTGERKWSKHEEYWPIALTPDAHLAVGAWRGPECKIDIWDAIKGCIVQTLPPPAATELYVDGIAISIDGKLVLCKTSDQKVRVWNVTEAKLVMTVEDPLVLEAATDYDRVSFSTDSKTAYSRHRVPRAWEIPSGKLIESCDKLPADRTPIVFSPDGRRCACRGALGSYNLEIFDPSEGKLLQAIVPVGKGPMRQIRVAEFSPNGRRLAVAGEGDLLQIWEIESGKLVQNLRREPGAKPN